MSKSFDVELINVQKKFGTNVVVDDFNLQIEQGECVSFLGPSGCGKTTTLNMIAGFLEPDRGDLLIKGKRMNGTPSNKRDLGMVFQTYSLFPHMTIFENVAYGLKLRKVSKAETKRRVDKVLDLVKLPHVAERYPKQLSGGQRQRIAIARALVTEPTLLLLDEPLSNLDAKLREELREEIKRLQRDIGVTTIFVTHDQEEALYMSNRIVVLDHGKVEQIGTPWDNNRPASEFVHTFIGKSNRLTGVVERVLDHTLELKTDTGISLRAVRRNDCFAAGDKVSIYMRPESIALHVEQRHSAATNVAKGTVKLTSFLGAYSECEIDIGQTVLTVRLQSVEQDGWLSPGMHVYTEWKPEDVFVFARKENGR
ncbi:polyamine ABC transporter ATPase [Gordoniibacillus kamchatkensis]|uniref:Polyamine ABC transporter ATPase n=1 Tax=Gordoniibacillus kamchatkensis TaxID=1590651 RepID=A0ABR5AC08_9BACL|nr:ABC transporter ATP-binding protein [Paenibacillus sp. VKM B-2647]KIL38378.1 polyamine ABC transporter ATPase [Paenibacillus sp. VKM B-2647]